ncbi:hypothetical protein PV08_07117 [Exophiala spinifera]|uniref:Uncharacterized protein n=1 Tax=Exophiala spinifera TaxID=91928 RepID=A0A0D2B6M3_9EURO|nr:uncharacterized protein PV08_07117 [Exophiala spinifera]KIW14335.1 hypothetical protein PV08_07117 [Exophiala spinifera]
MSSRKTAIRSPSAVSVADHDDALSAASTSASDPVPPLTRPASSASSSSDASLDTSMASSILGDGYLLEESQDGTLTLPRRYQEDADLFCPFQILDCSEVFADIVPFKMHVFSHFRGHELPTFAACFLCDNKYFQRQEDDPALAWNNMLSHMVHDHFRKGQQLATVRPDFVLMKWMFCKKIINEIQYKRTQMGPVPFQIPGGVRPRRQFMYLPDIPQAPSASPPPAVRAYVTRSAGYQNEAFTVNAGRRAERRRLDATRTMGRAQSYSR